MHPEARRDAPRLHCRASGEGPAVLLLHCSAGSGAQWRRLAGRLRGAFRVLAPDLSGYGASPPRDPVESITLTWHALLAARLVDACPGPLHLVGHSFGGAVALRLALMLGPRLRSLTLVEPVAFQLLRGEHARDAAALARVRGVAKAMSHDLRHDRPAAAMGRFVDSWNGEGTWATMGTARRAALAAKAQEVVGDFGAIAGEPTRRDGLARLTAPTLVLHGGRSPLPAAVTARRVAVAIPGARRVRIRDAGHMAPLTHPEMVDPIIATHLEQAERRARRARGRPAPWRLAARARALDPWPPVMSVGSSHSPDTRTHRARTGPTLSLSRGDRS